MIFVKNKTNIFNARYIFAREYYINGYYNSSRGTELL